jgi:hypothetical protein
MCLLQLSLSHPLILSLPRFKYIESHQRCVECDEALVLFTIYPYRDIAFDNTESDQLSFVYRECWDEMGYAEVEASSTVSLAEGTHPEIGQGTNNRSRLPFRF